jgi:hypothetical protein
MFADYLCPSMDSLFGIHDQTVKDQNSFRYKTIPDPRQNLTKSACLKPEKNTSPTQEAVRFRGIHKIEASLGSSTKNVKDFGLPSKAPAEITIIDSQL